MRHFLIFCKSFCNSSNAKATIGLGYCPNRALKSSRLWHRRVLKAIIIPGLIWNKSYSKAIYSTLYPSAQSAGEVMCSVLERKHELSARSMSQVNNRISTFKVLIGRLYATFAQIIKQTFHFTCISGIHKFLLWPWFNPNSPCPKRFSTSLSLTLHSQS